MSDRPNFLFIITDQHRADHLGCGGHPILQTPNIDSIAERGRQFDRFYVANPVCMPNRATLMTGRMPSVHGVRHNGIPLSLQSNTFVDLLSANGYCTALMGKSHLQNMTGHSAMMPRRNIPEGRKPPPKELAEALKPVANDDQYDQELPSRWESGQFSPMTLPFYGFDHVDLCTGHGDQVGGHYYHWLSQRHSDPSALRGEDNALPHEYVCPQAYRTAVSEELYPTRYVEEKTLEYIDARAADGAPFFAMASFPDPHHPFTPPGKYWGMYDPADMVLPHSFELVNDPPPHLSWAYAARDEGSAQTNSQNAFAVDERETREAMALTCGMIAMIDDAVGTILARLEEHGLAKNTIVVFTSDHGDFLGDHRLMLKGPVHYQGLIRVPFIWADTPDRATVGTSDALCGTLDIASTILERTQVEPFNGIQGRSLLHAIAGDDDTNSAMLIEADDQRSYFGFDKPIRMRTLVTRNWRMSVYQGAEWGEIYDLENDPDEMRNLWDEPSHASIRAELIEILARKQIELVDRSPFPTARA